MPAKGPLGSSGRLPGGGGRGGGRIGGGSKRGPNQKEVKQMRAKNTPSAKDWAASRKEWDRVLGNEFGTKPKTPNVRGTGPSFKRTKAMSQTLAQGRRETNRYAKEMKKRGSLPGPYGSVSARAQSVAKKPSARQMSSKRRGKK